MELTQRSDERMVDLVVDNSRRHSNVERSIYGMRKRNDSPGSAQLGVLVVVLLVLRLCTSRMARSDQLDQISYE